MNPNERTRITTEVKRLQAAFPQRPIEPSTIAVYVDVLAGIDPAVLRQAVDLVIRSDDWFPTVKRLLTICEEHAHAELSAATDRQWLERYINSVGVSYDPVTGMVALPTSWPNPVMQEAVRLFGWQRFQSADPTYLPRDWERTWNDARALVTKRVAVEGVGPALPNADRPALKVVS